MIDLPDNIDALTPAVAREVPAGEQTDLLCLRVMEVPARRWTYDQPKMGGRDSQIRAQYRISRTPTGAYRARRFIGDHLPVNRTVVLERDLGNHGLCSARVKFSKDLHAGGGKGEGAEHLASARLLLVTYAVCGMEVDH